MQFQSALAIFFLFWFLALFLVLPFSARTVEEAGEEIGVGHAESAPHRFEPRKIALRTTVVAAVLFGAYYLNYIFGWLTPEMLDWVNR